MPLHQCFWWGLWWGQYYWCLCGAYTEEAIFQPQPGLLTTWLFYPMHRGQFGGEDLTQSVPHLAGWSPGVKGCAMQKSMSFYLCFKVLFYGLASKLFAVGLIWGRFPVLSDDFQDYFVGKALQGELLKDQLGKERDQDKKVATAVTACKNPPVLNSLFVILSKPASLWWAYFKSKEKSLSHTHKASS